MTSTINTYQSGDLLKQIDIRNSILSFIEKIKSENTINNLSFIQSILKILEEKCKNKFFEEEIQFIDKFFNLVIDIIEKKLKYEKFAILLNNLDDKFNNLFTKESYKEFIDTICENIIKIDSESKNNEQNEQN